MSELIGVYGLAALAVFVTGVSKSGFGGLAMLAVPIMSMTMNPLRAAAVVLPILVLMDGLSLYAHRGKWRLRALRPLLGGAVFGIGAGTLGAHVLSADMARVVVGLVALGFVLWAWVKPRAEREKSRQVARPDGQGTQNDVVEQLGGVAWGVLAGYTSFVAHAGGPPAQAYLLKQELDKRTFTATSLLFFAVVNLLKVPAYLATGLITQETLFDALVLAPAAPLGVWVGVRLNERLDPVMFFRVIYGFLVVVGAKLLYEGFAGLTVP